GSEKAFALGILDDSERKTILHGPHGIERLGLHVQVDPRRPQLIDSDDRRAPDRLQNVVETAHCAVTLPRDPSFRVRCAILVCPHTPWYARAGAPPNARKRLLNRGVLTAAAPQRPCAARREGCRLGSAHTSCYSRPTYASRASAR